MNTRRFSFERLLLKYYEGHFEHKDQPKEIHWSKLWERYHNFNNILHNYYDL